MFESLFLDYSALGCSGKHLDNIDPSTSKAGYKDEFKEEKKNSIFLVSQMDKNRL